MLKHALAALVLVWAGQAGAHEVWIDRTTDGARIQYGEPGEPVERAGAGLDSIANPVVTLGASDAALAVTRHDDHLAVAAAGEGDLRLTDASYEPWVNDENNTHETVIYYARAGRTDPTTKLAYEIAPVASNADVFVVSFNGSPVANAEVSLHGPDGAVTELEADAEGRVSTTPSATGRYMLAASHEDAAPRTVQGKAIALTYHVTTLTFVR